MSYEGSVQQSRQFKMNLPPDVSRWVAAEAAKNLRSQSAEIVFALRQKMQATAGASFAGATPAVVPNTAACQGGNEINQG